LIRSFNGKTPNIAESAFVSEAAYVIGNVEIGENSSVWPGAIIRGDLGKIKIGKNTAVEDNCVLHADVSMEIGDNVLIGHSAVVHDVKIGNSTLIGNNATMLNNAQVGSFCIIGAGCLVTQGMQIPSNSFVVGVPAKIKGQISQEHLLLLQKGPRAYVELNKQYKQQEL